MIISLIGFMGCGKSNVGLSLNKLIPNSKFFDLDDIIEKGEGMSISQIFTTKGEKEFRKIEATYLNNFINKYANSNKSDITIFSLGGGSLSCSKSINLIKDNSMTFYLCASIDELINNLKESHTHRPMLLGYDITQRVKDLMAQREDIYVNTANYIINVDGLLYDEIAEKIINKLDSKT